MKICFLVSSLHAGGAERVATTLCNAWAARGDTVTLISTFSGTGECFYPLHADVEHVALASAARTSGKSALSYLKRFMVLRRLLAQCEPDVVISFLPHVNVAAILANALTRRPLVICERNDPSSRSPREFWEIASRLTFRFADVMTVQTEAVARHIHEYYPGLRAVRVLPNPLPEEIVHRQKARVKGARKVLLSMGRLDPQKQVDWTIDAYAALAPKFEDWDLHIYGSGALRDQLQAQVARHHLTHRVHFKGQTGEPWDVMEAADAFVMTSRHEGFPNALLEAMGLGLPCVVTDCPSGPRDITRDGTDGLLVPPGDRNALVEALGTVMQDGDFREALGQRARASVLERYRLSRVLDAWDELFNDMQGASAAAVAGAGGQPASTARQVREVRQVRQLRRGA